MQTIITRICTFLIIVLSFQACTKDFMPEAPEPQNPIETHAIQLGDGNGQAIYIGSNYTFKNNPNAAVDYIIRDLIIIYDSVVTVEPGCVIYFEGSTAGIMTKNKGAFYAQGTAENPIYFGSNQRWPGSWSGIFIGTDRVENVFNHCTFEYAGGESPTEMPVSAALGLHTDIDDLNDPYINVSNCYFKNNNAYGFYCASLKGQIFDFSFNRFENQQGIPAAFPLKKAAAIQSNNQFASLTHPNTAKYVLLFNDGFNQNSDLDEALTLKKLDVPYRFSGNEGVCIIQAGLTIEPGVVLEFDLDGGLLIKDGFLNATGTAADPIVFKGISGNLSRWVGISFQNSNAQNQLQYCEIVSAGSKKAPWCDGQAAVSLGNWFGEAGAARVENCRISNSGAYAIAKKSSSTLIQNANTFSLNQSTPDIYNYQ